MDLVLSPDERLVKDWKYAEVAEDAVNTEHKFTVTNKRVVVTERNESGIVRDEIAIDNIVGVSTRFATQDQSNKKPGITLIVLGALVAILSIVIAVSSDSAALYAGIAVGAVMIGLGIFLLLRKKVQGQLSVVLKTNLPDDTYTYGFYANTMTSATNKKSTHEITVSINLDIAEEIVNTIGSVILAKTSL